MEEEPSSASDDQVMVDDDNDDDKSEMEREELPKHVFKATHEVKLRELLHNINLIEIKLCSDATKRFIKLLKGDDGGELLHLYVQTSSRLSELLEAWKLRQGKPGLSYILSLLSVILSHHDGKYIPNDKERIGVSRVLDKFAQLLIEEKLGDVYKELNSKEGKRQKAALLLMAAIVRRGSGLASDVAKNFDFKLPVFSKLAEYKQKGSDKKRKHSTRKSFVGFAMSFLEVGKPGLLRWVLQQKEMYSGVLRGLGNDDDETVTYVLSTLRDRVLTEESLVPPGLRSVLFGSVTLEQLVSISGRENGGPAAELAHNVLVRVCTDPSNGLMPDMKRHPNPLRGNPNRLLALMKKLKATEIGYHRDLLLAILKGRPSFGSAYTDEFPYNLEDHASPTWFATVSLAADLVSSVGTGLSFGFLHSQTHDPPTLESSDMQSIMNCICSRPFSRSVINKGLLHFDYLVKHGTLRLLLEVLKLLDSFLGALNRGPCSSSKMMQNWESIKQEIQDKVRALLPDPQVLLTLLSSLSSHTKTNDSSLKRKADFENVPKHGNNGIKKLKTTLVNEERDIVVSGIVLPEDSETVVDTLTADELDNEKDFMNVISEIWGPDLCFRHVTDAGIFFHSKLLDALTIYLRTMPTVLEGSFEFFMNLLSNPVALPTNLQCSLLSLLIEYIMWSPRSGISIRYPPLMYKHLQPFINLFIFSPISDIKDRAYNMARAAMSSTGAFDRNQNEIDAWFLFLPGCSKDRFSIEVEGLEVLQSLSPNVISFLCDAISTIGNNLFKYWDIVRHHICHLKGFKDVSPHFSPFIICVLQKCLRLLNSESGAFSLAEKSLISLYVCSTIKYLLQTQVDAGLLSALIESVLSEALEEHFSVVNDSGDFFCEWRPLKNLLLFSQNVSHQQACCIFPDDKKAMPADSSFASTLNEVKKNLRGGHGGEIAGIAKAFSSAIVCATPDGVLKNFPSVMTISQNLLGIPVSLLSSTIFLEQSFLADASKLWPDMFLPGLEMAVSTIHHEGRACGIPGHSLVAEEMTCSIEFDARKSAASAFSSFLKQAPFHVLFPAIISIDVPYLSDPSKLQDLFLTKLSELTSDCLISYLRLVLFWFHQIRLSYRIKPSIEHNQLSEICFILVKHMVVQLLGLKPDSESLTNAGVPVSVENIQEVTETISCHPAVIASFARPLSCDEELTKQNIGDSLETFLGLSSQRTHRIDHHILDMLTATFDYLLFPSSDQHAILKVEDGGNKRLVKDFKTLTQRLFLELRDKFDMCIGTDVLMPLLPFFNALNALIRFMPPLELLELAHWMFSRVDVNNLTVQKAHKLPALSVGFCIAGGAFEVLSTYLLQPITKRIPCDLFWEMEEKNFDVNLIEEIYVEVCKFACKFELDFADKCLLKAVSVVYRQKHMQHHNVHPLTLVVSRVIMSTPIELISHCMYRTNTRKAKLLFLLTEMSPLHLSVFGHLFLGILNKDLLPKDSVREEACGCALSDEEYMMLLPAALTYLHSVSVKFGKQYFKHFIHIPSFYARLLFSGLLHWKSFVSKYFQEEYDECFPSSTGDLTFVNASLLGKAILMLRYHFALNGDSIKMKKRLKLFSSIFPSSVTHDELLDCDLSEIDCYSLNQSLNLINRVIGKISLGRMFLFPEDNQIQSLPQEADWDLTGISLEKGSNREDSSRLRFINILVSTWEWMIKKFPSGSCSSSNEKSKDRLPLYKYLENFILRSILELTTSMHDGLIKLQSIPFLEQMMRSSLLYRFEDPTTLKMLQNMLTLLSEGNVPHVLYLQLLLAHSQFAPTIHSVPESSCSQTGAFFRPMSSILRSVVIPHTDPNAIDWKNDLEATELYVKRLEIIKLLRTVLQFKPHQCGFDSRKDTGINLRELHSLLMSSYGATLSDTDLEIYNLMYEIESIDKSVSANIAEMDYLWGSAALKVRKEWALEQDTSNMVTDIEAVEERRRSQFRENLPIDPKICARTVLYFPYDRTTNEEPLSSIKLQPNNLKDMCEIPDVKNIVRYDPVFILRFSIHSLSSSYIEPVEFAGLGLLAVAFVSMSSPDVGMRKLGYETLGRFKNALEKCQKKKNVIRLRLLLTYVQNGIEEPWQRIPSIIALFAAETSFILLDPSHDHYSTLSKLMMHSSRVNMKCIPFFNNFFWSSSVNFRTERLWILRLTYAGLNSEDDAQIYTRNSILEILLSFYASPLSDNESKKLILQIVKKSVKLQKTTRYLVEQCALFSWLSSVLSVVSEMLLGDERSIFLTQLAVVVEIVNDVISSRSIIEWLQKYALEQLMELSSHLYKLLIGGAKLINENVLLVNSVLQTIISTLKISQKRKIYQPHFTVSVEGLFQIYQAVSVDNIASSSSNAELGLKTILMSTPPSDIFRMDQEKLSKFLMWATSTALKSDSGQMLELEESDLRLTVIAGEASCEESSISKLQRWLVASVILGKHLWKLDDTKPKISKRSNLETLQFLFESVGEGCGVSNKSRFDCEKILAITILYLQQLLGMRCRVLSSVVSALCLLLSNATNFADFMLGHGTSVASLCSRIPSPNEANPAWRWSFYQTWKDLSSELTDSENMDEFHACQTLLVIFSNVLGKKSLDLQALSHQDVENSGVCKWERSIIETE